MKQQTKDDESEIKKCPCCGRRDSEGKLVPLASSTTQMAPIGFAIPFFFRFGKFLIIQLAVLFGVYSLYALITYSKENYCNYYQEGITPRKNCGKPWNFYLSVGNSNPEAPTDWIERALFITSFAIMIGIRIYTQYTFRSLDTKLDNLTIDITDYTVMVYNLPKNVNEGDLRAYIRELYIVDNNKERMNLEVAAINFVYQDYKEIQELNKNLRKKLKEYRKVYDTHDSKKVENIKIEFNEKVKELEEKLNNEFTVSWFQSGVKKRFAGVAFVTLAKEEQANAIRDQLLLPSTFKTVYRYLGYLPKPLLFCMSKQKRDNFKCDKFGDNETWIFFDRTNPPEDILWENMGNSGLSYLATKILSTIGVLVILLVSFAVIVGLKYWQLNAENSIWVSIALTIVIKIVNAVSMFFNKLFISFEKITSFTMLNTEIVWRTTLVR